MDDFNSQVGKRPQEENRVMGPHAYGKEASLFLPRK